MKATTMLRHALCLAFLAAPLAGCDSSGTTEDTKPAAPPVTKENVGDLTKSIEAGAGGLKNAPGVSTKGGTAPKPAPAPK